MKATRQFRPIRRVGFLVTAAMSSLAVVACASGQPTRTPDIEATIAAALEATVAARFRITFTPEPGGFWRPILDPPPGPDGKYPAGTEVKIRAFLQLSHSRFVRWEGDASGTTVETSVIVDRDLRIHAVLLHIGTATAVPPARAE